MQSRLNQPVLPIVSVLALFAAGMIAPLLSAAEAPVVESQGRVDSVTVYRGQALVTRQVELPGTAGLHEIVVTDLPAHIVSGSLHAEADGGDVGVEVRSVRYRERPVTHDVREQVQQIEGQIRLHRDELQIVQHRLRTVETNLAQLDKLEVFSAQALAIEISHGLIDAGQLRELTLFIKNERSDLTEQQLRLQFEKRDIERDIEHLQRELNQLGATSTRTAREAVILVNAPRQGDARVNLHYLVDRATWEPSYTIRGNVDEHNMTVRYHAMIRQTSGEDWTDVEMTLSTASPSLVAKAPRLAGLAVELRPDGARGAHVDFHELRAGQTAAAHTRNIAPQRRRDGSGMKSVDEIDMMLNVYAGQLQIGEFRGDLRGARTTSSRDEGYTVTYTLPSRTSLPSRADQQLIQIASMPMDGEFYKVAIPVLTPYVYNEARTTTRTDRVLLAGPISTYADGQFVGHSEMTDMPVGESLTLGFGINNSLTADRELLDQNETIQGGNRVVDLTYRLTLENFDESPTVVRVFDRLPRVKPEQIKLTIVNDGTASERGVHARRVDLQEGLVRWDVEVPGRAVGDDAAWLEYTIRLEYDRQMTIMPRSE